MKLYIPTCSLNFNNIFSTESISPRGFYAKRGFGNKRFYPVEANSDDNVITLYNKFPRYKVEDDDLENYPMVIEIETDEYDKTYFTKVYEKDDVNTYICHKTIYLNPFNVKIYFDSVSAWQSIKTKAEQSLENKFSRLYSRCISLKQEYKSSLLDSAKNLFFQVEKEDFNWSESYSYRSDTLNNESYKDDLKYDKLKGFMYCYLIGANLSTSTEIGILKSLSKKLRNTLSAIVNSHDHRPTQSQDDFLLKAITEFNSIYQSIDEDFSYNKKILTARLESNPLNVSALDATKLLKHWGLYDDFCRRLNLRKTYDASELWNCIEYSSSDNYNRIVANMYSAVKKLEIQELSKREKCAPTSLFGLSDAKDIVIHDNSFNHSFYEKLIRSQLNGDYKQIMDDNDIEEPLATAFNGGKILKDMMASHWEGSTAESFIQGLLNHFQENEAFELSNSDSDVLKSFAAFCQKGDNIERLSEYLILSEISNLRLALGLYGATRGFASLPKTFTSSLIDGDKNYFVQVYKNFWLLLMGSKISDTDFPQNPTSAIYESAIGSEIINKIEQVESSKSKQQRIVTAVSKAVELEDAVYNPKAFMYIADNIFDTRSKVFKALKDSNFEEDQSAYTRESFRNKIYSIIEPSLPKSSKSRQENLSKINTILELEEKRQDPEAFLKILDNYLKPSDMSYRKIANLLNHSTVIPSKLNGVQPTQQARDIISNKESENKNSLPLSPTSIFFVDDMNVKNYFLVVKYLPEDLRKILSKKVTKFQEGYAANGRYASKPEDNPKDNDSTLDHFKRWCFYDKGSWPPIVKATPENRQLFEKLIMDLHIRYGDR